MDFVTVRALRADAAKVWARIDAGSDVVITRNGKPIAVLVGTAPDKLDATLRAIRAARLLGALKDTRAAAREKGSDRMTSEDIHAEVEATRKGRGARNARGR
jgi:prevent-host-death family protein